MNDSDVTFLKVTIGSLINALALGLLLSYIGQVYFNETGFFIGAIVGLLLSVGFYLIFSTISNER